METNDKRPIYINITSLTTIKIILILFLFYLLFLIRDILIILFISLVLSSALEPFVNWLQKRKIPRGIGILLIYFILFAIAGFVVYLLIPPIIAETTELANRLPQIIDKVISGASALKEFSLEHGFLSNIKDALSSFSSNFSGAAGGVFSTVTSIFGGIFNFILILVITFYMVVEENAMQKIVHSVAPAGHRAYVMQLVGRMQNKVGLWLRGQLILSLIIFTMIYIGLLILGVKYALILALIAGLIEFVPYLGPIMSAVPAVFLSFTQGGIMLAVSAAVLYYIVQLLENNIIVPKLMQRMVGLNPIVSIAVLLIGFQIAGIVGAVLSIPVATAASVLIQDLFGRSAAGREEMTANDE